MGASQVALLKNLPINVGDVGSIPESGRSQKEKKWQHIPVPCLGNLMVREAWEAPWYHKELDMTEQLRAHTHTHTPED